MDAILSVREVTERIKQTLETRFPYIWVRGEVANLSRPQSGHVYFSLKEQEALLACVWFAGNQKPQKFDPLTGEVWEDGPKESLARHLENGQQIEVAGRLGVYAARGGYQLVVETGQPGGLGAHLLALEALKKKLAAKGYFDITRKRPIPYAPKRVALVTAPTGAAVHDFIRVSADRGLGCEIRVYPALVQGAEAPAAIVSAMEKANTPEQDTGRPWADVLVLTRGGGSAEDLAAFNDERVADAVFVSALPVLTGIGHEVDRSLADLVADKEAATPSHAALQLWPSRAQYVQALDEVALALEATWGRFLTRWQEKLARVKQTFTLLSPEVRLQNRQMALEQIKRRLGLAFTFALQSRKQEVANLSRRFYFAGQTCMEKPRMRLEYAALKLQAQSPLTPLERGYALVEDAASGRFVRSVHTTAVGASIRVHLKDGAFDATVHTLQPAEQGPSTPDEV